ncbi:MAG TPA: CIA30 family protein [Treponemataceae bacterium]|nr:CIA30 family protein [Treponemataceae bacterium]
MRFRAALYAIQRAIPISFAIALSLALQASAPAALGAEIPAGELPHVAITGFANRTGDAAFDIPSGTAADSLILTLKLLGTYRVFVPGELAALPAELTDAAFGPWCEANGYDYCIYGSITRGSGGAQKYQLKVFDRAKGKTTITENAKGESALDVFSISDELAGAVIDSVTGRHVGYGSVNFLVQGPIEGCVALLDGIPVGSDLGSLGRIVAGTHRLSVSKKGAAGSAPLVDQEFEVAEGQDIRVDVMIPADNLAAKDQNWFAYDQRKNRGASACSIAEKAETIDGAERLARVVTGRLVKYGSSAGVVMKPGEAELERLRRADGITLRVRGDTQAYWIRVETSRVTDGNYHSKWVILNKKEQVLRIPYRELVQADWGKSKSFAAGEITGISIEPAFITSTWAPSPISFTFTVYDLDCF